MSSADAARRSSFFFLLFADENWKGSWCRKKKKNRV
jgi:hypothetical protein